MKQHLFIAALILTPLLWLFGRALLTDEMFVFRDAAHYYYPYYKYVAHQWGEGRVPLWNPLENLGQPLLADATAAVLYPGKLIFALPLGYDLNYKLYIVGHVLFAAINAYLAARGFARSKYGSAVCAISYAFSGSVLFQYCNVIFLVGAAWLPLAALVIDRMLRQRSWQWSAALAAILAMMVFGGDPQLAYHVGLIAVLYGMVLWRVERKRGRDQNAKSPPERRWLTNRIVLLAMAGGFAFLLAAAQVLPSMEWTPKTSRAATDIPRNVYELADGVGNEMDLPASRRCDFLLGNQENNHHIDSYVFSVGPWHLAGCLWPNVFGNLFPENTRWIRALPAEGRMWTPTLYMGLLPLLLALSQFRFRLSSTGRARLPPSQKQSVVTSSARQEPRPPEEVESIEHTSRRAWLTWTVILSLLASFGWYGLGWIIIEVYHLLAGQDAAELPIGSPLGGIYWLLQTFAPGYVFFRYPAKWLVVFACGMSLLSAYGWDRMLQSSARFVRWGLIVAMVFGVVANALIFFSPFWERLRRHVPVDDLFGPLNVQAAKITVIVALVHGIVLAAVLLWLIPHRRRSASLAGGPIPAWRTAALLWVVVLDLGIAQCDLVPTAWQPSLDPPLAYQLRRHRLTPDCQVPPRVYRRMKLNSADPRGAQDRLTFGQRRDRRTLYPKYPLLDNIDMLESPSAMTSQEFQEFMHAVRRTGYTDGKHTFPNPRALEMTSTEFFIARNSDPLQRAYPDGGYAWDWSRLQVRHLPRARVAYYVKQILEPPPDSPDAMYDRTRIVFDMSRRTDRDVVEMQRPLPPLRRPSGALPDRYHSYPCDITSYTPDRVELHAALMQDGLVVLADAYADGWTCEVTNRDTGELTNEPIVRTNRVMRGVWLPAGEYDVVFCYRPTSFYVGAVLSALGWTIMVGLGIRLWRRAS